jgi:tRNA U34 2-thiouridine synthase MnmA/TrmU
MSHRHKVAIAMSGAVDSAVAAALLQRQGWNLEEV